MSDPFVDKPQYKPSGRLEAGPLFAHAAVLFGLASLLAVGLAYAVRRDGYALGYIWILPVTVLASFVRRAVANANCRNPIVGALLGAYAGAFTLAGMYHVDQCTRWGISWDRVDRLPGYVTFRVETDGLWWPDGRMPCLWALPDQPNIDPYMPPRVTNNPHWLVVAAELFL